MKTRVLNIGQFCLSLIFCLGMASCNKSDYYQKDYLENPYQNPTTTGSVTTGGDQAGVDAGVGTTHGGVDTGVTGGTSGSTTGGSFTTGGSSTGDTTGGTVTGGTTDGGTTGGTTTGTATTGGTTGSTVGGTTGSTVGGTDGSTTGGTTGSTVGGTDGSTVGGTTGGTDGSTVGGTTGGTTGSIPEAVEENFSQTAQETKKLDIMWIVDDSGSMADEQDALGRNFDHFIRDFINRNVDFKMAITTTDTSTAAKKGKMVTGSDTKLTSTAAQNNPTQFINDFKSLVRVGTAGSGNEKGLEASEGFMQKYAASFLRPDAYLAVVIISDEEDQSPKTPTQYTDFLKTFKAQAGLVKVYTIVDSGMTNSGSGVTVGYQRYAQASQNTAGVVSNIRNDFYQVLEDMGNSIINLLDSFALGANPLPGSLKVYVNGSLVSNYTYDSASHSIKFDANSLPPVGAAIKVTYLK